MDAFLEEIERYKDELYRYIYRTAWDSSVTDDVFSEAVLAAYQNRDRFTPGSNFRAWLYKIVTNKVFIANRETSRTPEPFDEDAYHVSAIVEEVGYDRFIENGTSILESCGDEVLLAFRKLSTIERSCLMLRVTQGFAYKEIAEILDIPMGTVMTHLSRGRARLRRRLWDYAIREGILPHDIRVLDYDDPRSVEGTRKKA